MNTSAPSPAATDRPELTVADLKPAAGAFDAFDSMVLALCNISFITDDLIGGAERFCHQLRHAMNADTVYLCSRNRLHVTCTTSAANDVNNGDTQAIHTALLDMIADLQNCDRAIRPPDLRVFPEEAKLPVTVVPVSEQTLAVIVDADETYRDLNQYCADVVSALYRCQTAAAHDGFAPTTQQLQKFVLDVLNRHYQPMSAALTTKRYDMFMDDMTALDTGFEKLIEPQPAGNPLHWGWQAIARYPLSHTTVAQLHLSANEWLPEFQTALDLCVLQKAIHGYKSLCESANLQHFDEVTPLCVAVSLQSLQQPAYLDALREMIECSVIAGSHLVFEVCETQVSQTQTHAAVTITEIIDLLKTLREEFGVRFLLSDNVLRDASLTTLLALEPDFIRVNQFISKAGTQPVGALLEGFSLLAETGANSGADTLMTTHPAVPVSTFSYSTETENEAVPN